VHAAHGEAQDRGHDAMPHESPWTMTLVLVLLAAGSVLTLFLGLPALWTGAAPLFEQWLEPVLGPAAEKVHFAAAGHGAEWLFQGFGVLAATVGWYSARVLYRDGKSPAPAALQARFARAWSVVYHKYYVDEAYAFLVVGPSLRLARVCSWFDGQVIDRLVNLAGLLTRFVASVAGHIDRYLVDGAVNGVASLVGAAGRGLRHLQTGRIQTYLYGALGGALAVVLLNFLLS
jgi:NADH-quinone oxidoreductase subunit L